MPYAFKTGDLSEVPDAGQTRTFLSKRSHVEGSIVSGEDIFVFAEKGELDKDGGLVARGQIVEVELTGPGEHKLTIEFDGVQVSVPLPMPALDRFAHPQKFHLPETENARLSEVYTLLRNLAEIRRNTTHQPIHKLSRDACDWLNLYHFEKVKMR